MARSIQDQLNDAFTRSDLTLGELLRLTGLECSEDSLSRKLRSKQSLRTSEAEAIAKALRIEVTAGKRPASTAA